MSGTARSAGSFSPLESFRAAQAVMEVVRLRCPRFTNEDAVWAAFVESRGRGEVEYLSRIRAGGRSIVYAVLQDLCACVERTCREDLSEAVGEHLASSLLDRHLPDLLETTLFPGGGLADQILSLVNQMVAGTTGEVYDVTATSGRLGRDLGLSLAFRSERALAEYLRRSGREPERAFARSVAVFRGALRTLLARAIYGFTPARLTSETQALHGRFLIRLRPENRFNYEQMIEILTGYVRQLQKRARPEERPADDAPLHASPAMRAAWERLKTAAACDETVLLSGESGTGKSC